MNAAVDISALTYRYHDGTEALRDVSFRVAPGECVALLGPNGSGKSTLLLHLNGILPGESGGAGTVSILGETIRRETAPAVRRRVGLLFQDPDDQLFCATVEEDVAFGPMQLGLPEAGITARVRQALGQVGLADYGHRATHHLSHGEKRRACLAGVLACEPEVLALDEPTSGLDPRGRREFKALLQRIAATKLIATHDLELVLDTCPRVLVLDGGRLAADGPAEKLLADAELMERHGLEVPYRLRANGPA